MVKLPRDCPGITPGQITQGENYPGKINQGKIIQNKNNQVKVAQELPSDYPGLDYHG